MLGLDHRNNCIHVLDKTTTIWTPLHALFAESFGHTIYGYSFSIYPYTCFYKTSL